MCYRLTYDFGSGSVKAALSDREFRLCGMENEPYPTYFPRLGFAEQRPDEQWQAMCAATRRLLARTGIAPEAIEGIAMAQTGTTIIFSDETGRPLSNCVMWMDGRADRQAQELNARLGEKRFSGKNVYAKLLWFLQNRPELVEHAAHMTDVSSLLFYRMTGQWACELTGARSSGLLDVEHRCWDEAMFGLIGLPRHLAAERIVTATELVGALTEQAAQALGLRAGIAVFGGCVDHATAMLGTGCIRPGDAHIYIGTSAWLAVGTAADDPAPGRMPSPVPGMRYHFYDTDSGGSSIDYLLHTYYAKEAAQGGDVFAEMNREITLAQREGDRENVLFLPFLAGASAPVSNVTVRGTLLNLTRSTERRHIARAVMEGVCFNLRWMRDMHAAEHGWNINFLRGIGGGMQSAVFTQMLADVLDTPLTPLEGPRFAGNLGLQACIEIGLGQAADFSVLDRVVRCGKTCLPDRQQQARYHRLYSFFREGYACTEGLYRRLNAEAN